MEAEIEPYAAVSVGADAHIGPQPAMPDASSPTQQGRMPEREGSP